MSNLFQTYNAKQKELERLRHELEELENSEELKHEIEFKNGLDEVLTMFDKTPEDAMRVFDPEYMSRSGQPEHEEKQSGTRKKRKLKTYKNPHTGETIETRGGNQKTLKAWKEEYGGEEVENWLESEV